MQNQPSYSKAFSIKSIMGNPKLANIIFDAWEAPVGSTKNARAKAVMKSIEKSANRHIEDGQGGPGLQSATSSMLNAFNPFAGIAYNAYNNVKNTMGPTIASASGASSDPNPILSGNTPTGQSSIPTTPASAMNVPDTFANSTPKFAGEQPAPTGSIFLKTVDDLTPSVAAISTPEETAGTPETGAPTDTSPITGEPMVGDTGETSTEYTKNLLTNYKDVLDKYGVGADPANLPDYLLDINTAVEAGVGPTTFATQALADKDLLSKVLQIPKESLDWLPESGFLSDYLIDLRQETKDRYQIDNQLKRILDLENRGLTIESDLQSYIRGKDDYLGKLDKMYNDASEKIAYMDTSDPADAKRMDNYLNYLTILKGRQNQRYIDYLNTSVKTHENELSRAANLYKYTSEKFSEDFDDLKNGATEKYGRLQDMLEEMYTNVEGREVKQYEKEKRELDLINSALNIETDIINLQRKKEETTEKSSAFNTLIEQQMDELESGRDWGAAWESVKRQFPNVADAEIDKALGGGIAKTAEEAAAHGVEIGQPWGWAKPGAYAEWKQTKSPGTGQPSTAELKQLVYKIWDIPKEQGGLAGYTDAEKAVYIRQAGLNPQDFGIYE